jgi:tetracycline repressor-like protein
MISTHQPIAATTGCSSGQAAPAGTAPGLPNRWRTAATTALSGFERREVLVRRLLRERGERPRRRRELRRVAQGDDHALAADLGLELGGRAGRDHAAGVDHRDAVGEPVGLLQVLRGEQERGAAVHEAAQHVPQLVARARIQAGGRLVEEQHRRCGDQARRQIQPPAHAAGVGARQPAAGAAQAEPLPDDWREALSGIVRRTREVWLRHRWIANGIAERSSFGPNSIRHVEQSLQAISGLGLDGPAAFIVLAAVDDYALGHVMRQVAQETAVERDGLDGDEWRQVMEPYWRDMLATGEFPRFAELADVEWEFANEDRFELGLAWMLDGIAARYER